MPMPLATRLLRMLLPPNNVFIHFLDTGVSVFIPTISLLYPLLDNRPVL